MLDVLLIYPPSEFTVTNGKTELLRNYKLGKTKVGVWPPMGLLYLDAALKKSGFKSGVLDAFVHDLDLDAVLERIKLLKPRIVGISITTLQIRAAVQLASRIKKEMQGTYVCVGGPHTSVDPSFVERFNEFDFCVTGEAEITFPEVVRDVLAGGKPTKIYHGTLPQDLDKLEVPDRSVLNIKDYFRAEKPYYSMLTLRGCPYSCIFCSRVAISDTVRFRDPVKVVDEIEIVIKSSGIRTFVFLDDTFTIRKSHTIGLCNEIVRRGLKISWSCNTRANTVDEDVLKAMKAAGCHLILIGVESGDEAFRNNVVNKKITDAQIFKMRELCGKYKIPIGCYLMLGFPGETKKEIEKTVGFAVKADMDMMSIHTTTVYPGSRLFEMLTKNGNAHLVQQWDNYAKGVVSMDDLSLMYIPDGLTLKDLQKARKAAYLKFYFRPKIILKQLFKDLSSFKTLRLHARIAWSLLTTGKTSKDYK